jgi:diaminopimelate decarboxylase
MLRTDIRDNKLVIGGIPAVELTEQFGSPLYVYDAAVIRERFKQLDEAISSARNASITR